MKRKIINRYAIKDIMEENYSQCNKSVEEKVKIIVDSIENEMKELFNIDVFSPKYPLVPNKLPYDIIFLYGIWAFVNDFEDRTLNKMLEIFEESLNSVSLYKEESKNCATNEKFKASICLDKKWLSRTIITIFNYLDLASASYVVNHPNAEDKEVIDFCDKQCEFYEMYNFGDEDEEDEEDFQEENEERLKSEKSYEDTKLNNKNLMHFMEMLYNKLEKIEYTINNIEKELKNIT